MGAKWNISMFHYRNHGSAYSRVLMGVQAGREETSTFKQMLDEVGFRYWDETANEAYQLFLGEKYGFNIKNGELALKSVT